MDAYKEFQGKTLDGAIEAACSYFNSAREKLEIEIVNDAKTGIFGLVGAKKAKIRARRMQVAFDSSVLNGSTPAPENSGRDRKKSAEGREDKGPREDRRPRDDRKPRDKGKEQAAKSEDSARQPEAASEQKERKGGQRDQRPARRDERREDGRSERREDARGERRDDARGERRDDGRSERREDGRSERREERKDDRRDRREERAEDGESRQDRKPGERKRGDSRSDKPRNNRPPKRANDGESTASISEEQEGVERESSSSEEERRSANRRTRGGRRRTRGGRGRGRKEEGASADASADQADVTNLNDAPPADFDTSFDEDMMEDISAEPMPEANLAELDQDKLIEVVNGVVNKLITPVIGETPVSAAIEENRVKVTISSGDNSGLLIGREGQTLAAFQYLTNRIVAKEMGVAVRVQLDTGDYRERQDDKLREIALHLADKAKTLGKPQSTRPLSSYHRRIVHLALQGDDDIQTRSKGDGPLKRVIIGRKRKSA
ncbi:Jag N-terminal domain-containing protein [Desulfovibrio subterraneus]|uniref:protein jag n=1 Tax=Desulfovibrio subterraneus TaxID=2718620 RepID=UPI0022B8C2AA|nr:protein jag [Desulfovibrio subterraneus]WBF67723.1 Jag N-terminal domain-containing protein [Desulfovibrio subterraneus]